MTTVADAWRDNPGSLPRECIITNDDGFVTGYRPVHVRLFCGADTKADGDAPWPAGGGKPPTDWAISRQPHPFEIKQYALA